MAVAGTDPRTLILSLFERYLERYPDESETVARIREFVIRREDCFRRECLEGHVTGSAWLIDASGRRALLTHHRKLDIWVQLGGHADGDADVAAVALREATEESGLPDLRLVSTEIFDIDIHRIPARASEPEHWHYDCRFLVRALNENYVVGDESHDLAWIELDRMKEYTNEASVMRMVRKSP